VHYRSRHKPEQVSGGEYASLVVPVQLVADYGGKVRFSFARFRPGDRRRRGARVIVRRHDRPRFFAVVSRFPPFRRVTFVRVAFHVIAFLVRAFHFCAFHFRVSAFHPERYRPRGPDRSQKKRFARRADHVSYALHNRRLKRNQIRTLYRVSRLFDVVYP